MVSGTNGRQPVQTGYADVNGAQLYYEVSGEGHPVVFVHRGLLDRRMWDDQFFAFARHYLVIRYDIRGSGSSKMTPGDYSHYDDLFGLLRFLEVGQAHMVGLALGGAICTDFALEHPLLASALVLVSSALGGYNNPSGPVKLYQRELFMALTRMDPEEAAELSARMWVDGPERTAEQVNPDVRERAKAMMTETLSRPLESYLPKMLDPLAIERLGELRLPTLVITGDYDVTDSLEIADLLADKIAGAEAATMRGVGHMVNMEQPEAFNQLVLRFLNAHTP